MDNKNQPLLTLLKLSSPTLLLLSSCNPDCYWASCPPWCSKQSWGTCAKWRRSTFFFLFLQTVRQSENIGEGQMEEKRFLSRVVSKGKKILILLIVLEQLLVRDESLPKWRSSGIIGSCSGARGSAEILNLYWSVRMDQVLPLPKAVDLNSDECRKMNVWFLAFRFHGFASSLCGFYSTILYVFFSWRSIWFLSQEPYCNKWSFLTTSFSC